MSNNVRARLVDEAVDILVAHYSADGNRPVS